MRGAARLFEVARNPDPASRLPYLVRLPLPDGDLVVKAREPWPRTGAVYCHPAEGEWPDPRHAELVDQVPVRSCRRRGGAIDLVLDRPREHRSQLVFTRVGGRQVIFWQSPRTARAARPGVRMPGRRAAGLEELTILVDTRERYPWRFGRQQAVTLERRALPAGDYAVEAPGGAELAAVVERKTLADLAGSLVDGSLNYLLAELAAMPRAAVVVEDRYAGVFKLEHVQPGFVADLLGALAVRYPAVPIVFCDTRPLAQEWAYRFLGAAVAQLRRAAQG